MQFRNKIPSFVLGVSIGLLIGIAFFLFKIDSIFKNLKSSLSQNKVTVVEEKIVPKDDKKKSTNKDKYKIENKKQNQQLVTSADSTSTENEDLNVATDQMISSKEVKLIVINSLPETDSLTSALAGVQKQRPQFFTLEFWKTPLNSKGYRFTKNKLMLYGFSDQSNVVLYQFNGKYYIKSFEIIYEVENNPDFQPLVKVNNSELLSKLDS